MTVKSDIDDGFGHDWDRMVMEPIRASGVPLPELVTVHSSYRTIISPLMDYIMQIEKEHPSRKIAVLIPELVVKHWWENILHNQRTQVLKLLLLVRGNERIVVVNIPWYL